MSDSVDSSPRDHAAPGRVEVQPILGIGELRPGDDLAALIAENAPDLRDGDILVVTSKVISKIEGRLVALNSTDPDRREAARLAAIEAETVRVVAQDELALLPVDPDRSAAALRDGLRARLGIEVGIVISDSAGRPWRAGIVDYAIGVAGVSAIFDARGSVDRHGNELIVTEVAVADELAAAADLVKGKLTGVPVAIVRGLARDGKLIDDGLGSTTLIRDADEDLFRLGTAEAIELGRAEAIGAIQGTAPALHADAVAVVAALPDVPPADAAIKYAFLAFLAARPDAMDRSCAPGHLTASTMVVDPARRKLLLTLHPRVGRWLQVGGHCERTDATVLDTARREAREESGLSSLAFDPTPLCLDVHPITCSLGVPTRHFDVRYLAIADSTHELVCSDESLDLAWFDWDALPDQVVPDVARSMRYVQDRLAR